MEPGESSLQLMLRYRLARFNLERGKNWEVEWFTIKKHQGFSGSKVWGHISKGWKSLAKNIYQLPPCTRMELLYSNIWWSDGVELLKEGCSYSRGLELYRKGIRRVDDVWDSNRKDFLPWEVAQHKFKLIAGESQDWEDITNKLSVKWRGKLEEESDTTYSGMWLGLYVEGQEDPAFVVRCGPEFTPSSLQFYNISLLIPATCYTVGTYSRCLRKWMHPIGEFEGHFHEVKVVFTNRGAKKEGEEEREEVIFFYGKIASLFWDPDRWRLGDGGKFLDYTTKGGR